jgi:hypothetical protein
MHAHYTANLLFILGDLGNYSASQPSSQPPVLKLIEPIECQSQENDRAGSVQSNNNTYYDWFTAGR